MPPFGISSPGDRITDPNEILIRRVRLNKRCVRDQITGHLRPIAAAFEPRLPETRPLAKEFEDYLSVNILSSLTADSLAADWGCDHSEFYAVSLLMSACTALSLPVTWEPQEPKLDGSGENPHHGGIRCIVELHAQDNDAYQIAILMLAKSAEVLPECLVANPRLASVK